MIFNGRLCITPSVALLGFGLEWAWTYDLGLQSIQVAHHLGWGTTLVLPVLSILTFAVVVLLAGKHAPFWRCRLLRMSMGVVSAAGTLLMGAASSTGFQLPEAFWWAGVVPCGISASLLLVFWSEAYAFFDRRAIALRVGRSLVLGAAACLVSWMLPTVGRVALDTLLPLLSLAALGRWSDADPQTAGHADESTQPYAVDRLALPNPARPFGRFFLGLVVFGAVFELFPALVVPGGYGAEGTGAVAGFLPLLAVGATGAGVALAVRRTRAITVVSLFRLVTPATSGAFLVVALLGQSSGVWAYAAMKVGETLLDVVIWTMLADFVHCPADAARVYALGRLGAHVGRVAGLLAGGAGAASLFAGGTTVVISVCLVMMYVLLLTGGFMVDRRADSSRDGAGSAGHDGPEELEVPLEERCRRVAAERGLSPREAEVLLLLARGRSIPYIQQQLGIAQSTAKTHSHRVYEKLGVHTKQELLDYLDAH